MTILIAAAIVAVAALGAAFMFTQRPSSSSNPSGGSSSGPVTPQIACLQGGGSWDPGYVDGVWVTCKH